MRWDKENLDELRAMLRRCDEICKQMDEAEISGTDAAKLMMDFESETTWAASTVFAFAADVLRAFDLIASRCDSPLEALLAAAELVAKETGHGD